MLPDFDQFMPFEILHGPIDDKPAKAKTFPDSLLRELCIDFAVGVEPIPSLTIRKRFQEQSINQLCRKRQSGISGRPEKKSRHRKTSIVVQRLHQHDIFPLRKKAYQKKSERVFQIYIKIDTVVVEKSDGPEIHRIDVGVAASAIRNDIFQVEMWPGGVSGGSHKGDDVSSEDRLTNGYEDFITMAISGKCIRKFMIEKHLIPVAVAIISGLDDNAVEDGRNRRACFVPDIQPGMEGIFSTDWVVSPAERRRNRKISSFRNIYDANHQKEENEFFQWEDLPSDVHNGHHRILIKLKIHQ